MKEEAKSDYSGGSIEILFRLPSTCPSATLVHSKESEGKFIKEGCGCQKY